MCAQPPEVGKPSSELLVTPPGGMIMVHGMQNHIRSPTVPAKCSRHDWTDWFSKFNPRNTDDVPIFDSARFCLSLYGIEESLETHVHGYGVVPNQRILPGLAAVGNSV